MRSPRSVPTRTVEIRDPSDSDRQHHSHTKRGTLMVMPDQVVQRVSLPEGRSRALAAGAVGSFWILPLVAPLLLRPFMTGRPFALHYFRYALIVQGVFVLALAWLALRRCYGARPSGRVSWRFRPGCGPSTDRSSGWWPRCQASAGP